MILSSKIISNSEKMSLIQDSTQSLPQKRASNKEFIFGQPKDTAANYLKKIKKEHEWGKCLTSTIWSDKSEKLAIKSETSDNDNSKISMKVEGKQCKRLRSCVSKIKPEISETNNSTDSQMKMEKHRSKRLKSAVGKLAIKSETSESDNSTNSQMETVKHQNKRLKSVVFKSAIKSETSDYNSTNLNLKIEKDRPKKLRTVAKKVKRTYSSTREKNNQAFKDWKGVLTATTELNSFLIKKNLILNNFKIPKIKVEKEQFQVGDIEESLNGTTSLGNIEKRPLIGDFNLENFCFPKGNSEILTKSEIKSSNTISSLSDWNSDSNPTTITAIKSEPVNPLHDGISQNVKVKTLSTLPEIRPLEKDPNLNDAKSLRAVWKMKPSVNSSEDETSTNVLNANSTIPDYFEDEKEDLLDPGWDAIKCLDSNESRYRQVRQKWTSSSTVNPNKNLTYHSFRKRHCNPAEVRTAAQHKRKATCSASPEVRKRSRTCTATYDERINTVKRERKLTIESLKVQKLRDIDAIELKCSQEKGRWLEYTDQQGVQSYFLQKLRDQYHNDRMGVENEYKNRIDYCSSRYRARIVQLEEYRNEVLYFNKFYQGLTIDQKDPTELTECELQELKEIDNVFDQMNECYKDVGSNSFNF